MKSTCERIREALAAEGARALGSDEAARHHVAECEDCFRFLAALAEIDSGLAAMGSFDAPEPVVAALLARPELAAAGARAGAGRTPWRRLRSAAAALPRPRPLAWGGVAAALLLFAFVVGLRRPGPDGEPLVSLRAALDRKSAEQHEGEGDHGAPHDASRQDEVVALDVRKVARVSAPDPSELEPAVQAARPKGEDVAAEAPANAEERTRFTGESIADLPVPGRFYRDVLQQTPGVSDATDATAGKNPNSIEEMEILTKGDEIELHRAPGGLAGRREEGAEDKDRSPLLAGTAGIAPPVPLESDRVRPDYPAAARAVGGAARVVLQLVVRADGTASDVTVLSSDRPGLGFEESAVRAVERWRFEPARQGDRVVAVLWTVTVDFEPPVAEDAGPSSGRPSRPDPVKAARAYLDERAAIEGLAYQPASGYWSNAYVPGDSLARWLAARLAGRDRARIAAHVPASLRLHDAARRVGQPFDAPDGSALAVYLHADGRALAGEGRLLVQVGLEGAPRHGGRRPAMNVALVLDVREGLPTDDAIRVRALLEAFNRARESGDRFRLLLAGRPGGCVVEPESFRHGSIRVALDRLAAGPAGRGLDLAEALRAAIESVAGDGDEEDPLGSNAVYLITGGTLGEETNALAELAHRSALAGIPVGVIGVGSEVESAAIDRVALAGQGSRRLLHDAAGAADLVDRELASASRAVARAVRLRVRLAPGVKLVGVLGSERLDENRAQRVREAERSLDLRLAQNLGIEADRGEDEEGIQIVIPSFYAGDAHAILLDVVAPGPGPVADVTVRYKDLVRLRNGVARASLALAAGDRPPGPLERNVLKNELSLRASRALDEAGRALGAGDAARAAARLDSLAALLEGLPLELPALDGDPDLERDLAMLAEYRALLAGGIAAEPGPREFLADSLRYAARRKLLPPPPETLS
jgi:TonB family protein